MAATQSERNKKYRAKPGNREKCNKLTSEWDAANRGRRNTYMRDWLAAAKAKDPIGTALKRRAVALKRRYGISVEDYEALLSAQNGRCALCPKTPDQERYGNLNVDHCHETNRIRGLLCTPCNHAIGQLGDTEASIFKALEYLRGA